MGRWIGAISGSWVVGMVRLGNMLHRLRMASGGLGWFAHWLIFFGHWGSVAVRTSNFGQIPRMPHFGSNHTEEPTSSNFDSRNLPIFLRRRHGECGLACPPHRVLVVGME